MVLGTRSTEMDKIKPFPVQWRENGLDTNICHMVI